MTFWLSAAPRNKGSAPSSWLHRRKFRNAVFQVLLLAGLAAIFYLFAANALTNLRQRNIASGFGFLNESAGFGIISTPGTWLVGYSESSTYFDAFLVGLINTLAVAIAGIVFATLIGFVVGIARLSSNWLVARLATAYVEILRNIPLLLQLFFWYFAVLRSLPRPRQSISFGGGFYLNARGLFTPSPVIGDGMGLVLLALAVALAAAFALHYGARRRRERTGRGVPVLGLSVAFLVGLPLLAFVAGGAPLSFDYPQFKGFNFSGGAVIVPELVSLVLALSLYTATFIAEIVRSGILAVSRGQLEAAHALGLRARPTLRLVVIPQAMRVIIPPLTSQYLNLTKNSSLAVAIAYPDLVSIFAGTSLNQTGQAIEILLITMGVFVFLSLVTSALMNLYNRRTALVER